MINKDVGKKIPIGVPTVIGLVSQFVVCILFGFRYTNGYESEPIRAYLVNSYDFLLIISSVLITLVSLFLLIGLAVTTLEKLRPLVRFISINLIIQTFKILNLKYSKRVFY